MKLHHCLACAMLAALPLTVSVAADASEIAALRAEIEKLKQGYELRIQALERRLAETEAATRKAESSADRTLAASAAAASSSGASGLNPDVSLILQGRYTDRKEVADRRITGYWPAGHEHDVPRGFSLDHSELVVSAHIDPYFSGYFNLALLDGEAEVEEAWFQTTSLGGGFTLKGGRYRSGLGYQNERHPHAWDFADNNLMYRVLFGESYRQDGLQLKWLAPTDLFLEFGAELGRGDAFPGSDRNKNGAGSYTLFGHVGGDVGASHSWRAGLSYLDTRAQNRPGHLYDFNDIEAETAFTGKSRHWIADFVWKWAPDGNATRRNFTLAAEYFRRREQGDLLCEDNSAAGGLCNDTEDAYRARQSGFYAQAVYQFMPRWRVGYRYDRLYAGSVDFGANAAFLPSSSFDPSRHSLMFDYSPSEYSRLRLQFARDKSMEGVAGNQWTLQYIHSLGAHGAHKF